MATPAPPYFVLKRTVLIVICVLFIVFLLFNGLFMLEDYLKHMRLEYGEYAFIKERKCMIRSFYIVLSFFTLVTGCGLLGAWYHNLPLMCIFTAFTVFLFLNGITSDEWPISMFFGAVSLLALCIMVDLRKMKRNENKDSIQSEPANIIEQC